MPSERFRISTCELELALPAASRPAADNGEAIPSTQVWYPVPNSGAPPERLPVILYFSGWAGTRMENALAARELASHGLAVISVLYPQKRPGTSDAAHRSQIADLERPMDFSSETASRDSIELATRRARARARDASIVVDALSDMNARERGRFEFRFDLDRVGIFGFSFGGAVAAQAAWLDRRFKAAVNLDGWHFAEAGEQGVDRPYLLLSDDTPLPTPEDLTASDPRRRAVALLTDLDHRRALQNLQRHGGYYFVVTATAHSDFIDPTLRSRVKNLLRLRRTRRGSLRLINACVLEFFAHFLLGRPSDLFAGDGRSFPEIRRQMWRRPQV
jgi:dienelactone hydrolase